MRPEESSSATAAVQATNAAKANLSLLPSRKGSCNCDECVRRDLTEGGQGGAMGADIIGIATSESRATLPSGDLFRAALFRGTFSFRTSCENWRATRGSAAARASERWRREWDSNPRYGFTRTTV